MRPEKIAAAAAAIVIRCNEIIVPSMHVSRELNARDGTEEKKNREKKTINHQHSNATHHEQHVVCVMCVDMCLLNVPTHTESERTDRHIMHFSLYIRLKLSHCSQAHTTRHDTHTNHSAANTVKR